MSTRCLIWFVSGSRHSVPRAVVKEFAEDLKRYDIHEVIGDRYGGEWPRERFLTHGINYKLSEKTKSEIYQAALPMLNSGRVELLDNKTLRTQLVGLERRTSRGGRDTSIIGQAGATMSRMPRQAP